MTSDSAARAERGGPGERLRLRHPVLVPSFVALLLPLLVLGCSPEDRSEEPAPRPVSPSRIDLFALRTKAESPPRDAAPFRVDEAVAAERVVLGDLVFEQIVLPFAIDPDEDVWLDPDSDHARRLGPIRPAAELRSPFVLPGRLPIPLPAIALEGSAEGVDLDLPLASIHLSLGNGREAALTLPLPPRPVASTLELEVRTLDASSEPVEIVARPAPGDDALSTCSVRPANGTIAIGPIPGGPASLLRVELRGGGPRVRLLIRAAALSFGADRIVSLLDGEASEPRGVSHVRATPALPSALAFVDLAPSGDTTRAARVRLLPGRVLCLAEEPLAPRPSLRSSLGPSAPLVGESLEGVDPSLHDRVLAVFDVTEETLARFECDRSGPSRLVVLQPAVARFHERVHSALGDGLHRIEIDDERRPVLLLAAGEAQCFDLPATPSRHLRLSIAEADAPLPRHPEEGPGALELEVSLLGPDGATLFTDRRRPARRGAFEALELELPSPLPANARLVLRAIGPDFELAPEGRFLAHSLAIGEPRLVDPRPHAPGVLVYLVDTLRADHLSLYGYPRDTSPNLEALAPQCTVFEHAYANCSWTRPSTASLLTGLHPLFHGAHNQNSLAPEVPTLAGRLHGAGFATAAIVANPNVSGFQLGFDEGFDRFRRAFGGGGDQFLTEAASFEPWLLTFLDEHRGEPWFLYVHSVDPHSPYTPAEEEWRRYDPDYTGSITGLHQGPGAFETYPEPSPADVAHVEALYDAEIRGNDRSLHSLLGAIEQRGLWDDCTFVFTADHGEEFREHGGWMHGRRAFEELLHVPLLFKPAAGSGWKLGRTAHRAQLSDIAPTLCELLGVEGPPFSGDSLLPVLRGVEDADPARTLWFDEEPYVRALLRGDRKLVQRDPAEGGLVSLFDLAADPRELHDLASASLREVAELGRELEDFGLVLHEERSIPVPSVRSAAILSAEELEQLRRVGYSQR